MIGASTSTTTEFPVPITVSVIIPVYNAQNYLEDCLESISACTYRPLECVFFDDGSSDSSVDMIREWEKLIEKNGNSISIIVKEQQAERENRRHGPGYARNEAILASGGELICHLDADDTMTPERISELVKLYLLNKRDPLCLMGSNFERFPRESTGTSKLTTKSIHMPLLNSFLLFFRRILFFLAQ
jgi:glycosyltransferase involved in cell wall biosynthesis